MCVMRCTPPPRGGGINEPPLSQQPLGEEEDPHRAKSDADKPEWPSAGQHGHGGHRDGDLAQRDGLGIGVVLGHVALRIASQLLGLFLDPLLLLPIALDIFFLRAGLPIASRIRLSEAAVFSLIPLAW